MRSNLQILLNRSELGAGKRGASLGIDALMLAAKVKGSKLKDIPSISVNDKNHILGEPNNYKWAKHVDALVEIYEAICNMMVTLLHENKFPLVISGDHASAGGTVAGIKKANPNSRIGIVWIDAHADLHSPYTSPTGNVHGMPLATIFDIDNIEFDPGDVQEETIAHWEKLKRTGGIVPKAKPEDLVYISVRDTEKEEKHLIEKYNITNFTTEEVRNVGVKEILSRTKNQLSECDYVYVSFDVDSLDSKLVSSGTGTPVEGGLLVDEAKHLLRDLYEWEKTIALEVTEINPLLDDVKSERMAEIALDILEYTLYPPPS